MKSDKYKDEFYKQINKKLTEKPLAELSFKPENTQQLWKRQMGKTLMQTAIEFKPNEEITLEDLQKEIDIAAKNDDWIHVDDLLDIYLEKKNGK